MVWRFCCSNEVVFRQNIYTNNKKEKKHNLSWKQIDFHPILQQVRLVCLTPFHGDDIKSQLCFFWTFRNTTFLRNTTTEAQRLWQHESKQTWSKCHLRVKLSKYWKDDNLPARGALKLALKSSAKFIHHHWSNTVPYCPPSPQHGESILLIGFHHATFRTCPITSEFLFFIFCRNRRGRLPFPSKRLDEQFAGRHIHLYVDEIP